MAFASAALQRCQRLSTGGMNPAKPSAVDSGLVGVTTNPNNNSYHHSKNSAPFKSEGVYTNRFPNDLVRIHGEINRDAVTGSDRSMNRADMIKDYNDHLAVFNDHTDPRRAHIAEYIGTPNGTQAYRMDFGAGTIKPASADHTWHAHKGWWYLYWGSEEAANHSLSINRGETKAQYLDQNGQGSTTEEDGDEMILTAQLDGHQTVWKGNGTPGTLMALHSMRAMGAVQASAGQHHMVFDNAQEVVDYLGTLPGKGNEESVTAIEGA